MEIHVLVQNWKRKNQKGHFRKSTLTNILAPPALWLMILSHILDGFCLFQFSFIDSSTLCKSISSLATWHHWKRILVQNTSKPVSVHPTGWNSARACYNSTLEGFHFKTFLCLFLIPKKIDFIQSLEIGPAAELPQALWHHPKTALDLLLSWTGKNRDVLAQTSI